jgi:hypothetical protein
MAIERKMTFSGAGIPGDLLDPNNWVGGIAPGVNDSALITMNVGGPIGGTLSVNNMMLLGKETIAFTGTLDVAGLGGDCQGLMVCVGAGALFAPGATLNDGGVLVVGNGAPGTLLGEGSGTTHSVINSFNADLGKLAAGVGIVTIDDGVWNNTAGAVIGDAGSGTLNVIDNGSANFKSLEVARSAGSTGQVTIASGGSVNVENALSVGFSQSGPSGTATVSVAGSGSLTIDGGAVIGDGSQLALAGGTVTAGAISETIVNKAAGLISGYGTLAVSGGQAIENDGIIRASGGHLQIDESVTGTGTLQIAANSMATITGNSIKLAGIAFIGPAATLTLAHGANVAAPISGFALGDIIAMVNVTAATFTASTGMLALSDNGVHVDSLHLLGSFVGDTFGVQQTVSDSIISLHHS